MLMKISEISALTDVPIYTVRYYIKKGLLVPKAKNRQYDFSQEDIDDLRLIEKLKKLEFGLQDIHKMLSFRRMSNLNNAVDIERYKNFFKNQHSILTEKKKNLENTISNLEKEIAALKPQNQNYVKSGVPISMLHLLCCPHCNRQLQIKNAEITDIQIFNGELYCGCGYSAFIENGIIVTEGGYISKYDWPDYNKSFTQGMPANAVSILKKTNHCLLDYINSVDTANKIIYENHINIYSYIYFLQQNLPKNAKYIISDKFKDIISLYKDHIDRANLGLEIIYIADSTFNPPIKKKSVDIFLDSHSNNEFMFFNQNYIQDVTEHLCNDNYLLCGTFLSYESQNCKSIENLHRCYPESSADNFNYNNYKKHFLQSGKYRLITEYNCGYTENMNECEGISFHSEKEKMYFNFYVWQKN